MIRVFSGVARGVAGVAEATPIIQFLFNKFGQKIRVKKLYLLQATPISKSYLPPCFYLIKQRLLLTNDLVSMNGPINLLSDTSQDHLRFISDLNFTIRGI